VKHLVLVPFLLLAGLASLVPFLALVGLGAHRHAPPWAVSGSAIVLVYVPILLTALWNTDRPWTWVASTITWAFALTAVLPVYFPGERNDALRTGFGLLGMDARDVFPDEPELSRPEVATADAAVAPEPRTPSPDLGPDQMALPYEGEGRRVSVPIVFGNAGRELEVEMMFDTGATFTTLGTAHLEQLGVSLRGDHPSIELHTANGVRTAQLVLLDQVWVGDLAIGGVAIAVCDDCASDDTAGLLGLNVSGGFNIAIDADHREVVFTRRATFDRKLDVKPFVELDATFTKFPGGRVEVAATLDNRGPRAVSAATASVRCPAGSWTVELGAVEPGATVTERRKLPAHDACAQYEIGLQSASW
jgi:clan AA aspartic protease (TIGR02281 family)